MQQSKLRHGVYKLVSLPHASKPYKLTVLHCQRPRTTAPRWALTETHTITTPEQAQDYMLAHAMAAPDYGMDWGEYIDRYGMPAVGTEISRSRLLPLRLDRVEHEERLPQSLARTRRKVFEYAMCNDFEFFVTLTIDPTLHDRYDLTAYKKKLGIFVNNYKKRKAPNLQYLLIPEYHKDGAVHMHGLVRGIPDSELVLNRNGYLDWPAYSRRFGYFSCSAIRNYEACARYVSKYITKDLADFERVARGKQLLLCSKGLQRPEVVDMGDGMAIDDTLDYRGDYCSIGAFENLDDYARYKAEHCKGA